MLKWTDKPIGFVAKQCKKSHVFTGCLIIVVFAIIFSWAIPYLLS